MTSRVSTCTARWLSCSSTIRISKPASVDFGGKAMTYYGRWTYKYEEAARRGALGILIVHETAAASYGWATVVNSNTDAVYDIVRKDPSQVHVPLEGWIQRDVAVALFRQAGVDFEAAKQIAQTREFKPLCSTVRR